MDTIIMTLTSAVSLALAAIGEVITEKAGVLNLSIDGVMSLGGLVAFVVVYQTNKSILGILAAGILGAFLGFLHATFAARGNNQILIGVVPAILFAKLANLLGQRYVNKITTHLEPDILLWMLIPLAVGTWFLIQKTHFGLGMRAVGEYPNAAHANGVKVIRTRIIATVLGSALFAIAGAHIVLVLVRGVWSNNIVNNRGWVAYAIAVFSGWNPILALVGAILFGAATIGQFLVQGLNLDIPPSLLSATPYVLAGIAYIRSLNTQPAALGQEWSPENIA